MEWAGFKLRPDQIGTQSQENLAAVWQGMNWDKNGPECGMQDADEEGTLVSQAFQIPCNSHANLYHHDLS
jgi:hypothetical protein